MSKEYAISYLGVVPKRLRKLPKPQNKEQAIAQGHLLCKNGAEEVRIVETVRTVIMHVGSEPCATCEGEGKIKHSTCRYSGGAIMKPCLACAGSGRKSI